MRTALIQMTSGDTPADNIAPACEMVREAAASGAQFILTPEVTNCLSSSRSRQQELLSYEEDDAMLSALRQEAVTARIWLLIGSLGIKTGDPDGRFANRSFLIGPDGVIRARYDKIHMFDVQVTPEETFRESEAYRPGSEAVVAPTPFGTIGMSVCYDVRFAYLYRALAQKGAAILTVPAAFSAVTGAAHWEPLLRARAIETGCYVLAPAQTGVHYVKDGQERRTYGHSMAVSPWGEVLVDAGTDRGVSFVDLDLDEVTAARQRIAALTHDRSFDGP